MISQNYNFFPSNQWQFTVVAPFNLAGYTAYCTAKKDNDKIQATTSIVGSTVTVTFSDTDVRKGVWFYDVEVFTFGTNITIQRGAIQVL